MKLAVVGVVVGLVVAAALTRFMATLLHGVSPLDPGVFVTATALVLGIAWLASYLPARRAMNGEPFAALRGDRTRGA